MDSHNVEEVITCGICLETFNGDTRCPRILNCGHSFCHSCLEKLIEQSLCCPTCKKDFLFKEAASIPINLTIKSLMNIKTDEISRTISSKNPLDLLESDYCAAKRVKTNSKSFISERHCEEHNLCLGMRCMDCEEWICGECVIHHLLCRTLVEEEAYIELKKHLPLKVEAELGERKATFERLDESMRTLEEEKKCLIVEIKKKEQELKGLESFKSDGKKFCQKLERLHGLVESSAIGYELSKAIVELEKLLEEQKTEVPDDLPALHLPITLKKIFEDWCSTRSVYVQEDRFDGTKYGKVTVKDGRVLIHNFQPEKPQARLIQLKELLSKFNRSTELPITAFLRLTPEEGGKEVYFLIQTDRTSPRAKKFLLLCSGLKETTFKGWIMYIDSNGRFLTPSPVDPVVDRIRYDVLLETLRKIGIYGMYEGNSWLEIPLKDFPLSYSSHKIGSVVSGLQDLIIGQEKRRLSVSDCGLVI